MCSFFLLIVYLLLLVRSVLNAFKANAFVRRWLICSCCYLTVLVVHLSNLKQLPEFKCINLSTYFNYQNWQNVFVVHIQMTNVSMSVWVNAASRNLPARQTFWDPTSTVRSSVARRSWNAPPRYQRWLHNDLRKQWAATARPAANREISTLQMWRQNRLLRRPRSPRNPNH